MDGLRVEKQFKNSYMLELNEMKKDLYKSKAMAKFSHYQKGKLYYNIKIGEITYQFPISTIEFNTIKIKIDLEDGSYAADDYTAMDLSSDLGETTFNSEIKGSELIRWIDKASKIGELIKIG